MTMRSQAGKGQKRIIIQADGTARTKAQSEDTRGFLRHRDVMPLQSKGRGSEPSSEIGEQVGLTGGAL